MDLLWSVDSRVCGLLELWYRGLDVCPCGIFPDQGSNLCSPHWQADSYLSTTREVLSVLSTHKS